MIWLVGSLIYAFAALLFMRPLAGHFAYSMMRSYNRESYSRDKLKRPTGEQWFGAYAGAVALAIIWPLVLVPLVMKDRLVMGAEREEKLASAQRRVKELERELLDLEPS